MKKVYFKTFGCRTNLFDTQVMIANIGEWGVTTSESEADVVVINSCTVTNNADSTVRSYINRLKREKPQTKILFTGCGVITQGEKLLKDGKIDGLFGHSEKERVDSFLDRKQPFSEIGNFTHIDSTIITNFDGKHRAFIKIQEGCDFECSYCIIPTVRGGARSYPLDLIVRQIETLADQGFEEFVLTGTNMGSYGVDISLSLADLVEKVLKIDGVKRLRLGSMEPLQVSDRLIELLQNEKAAKHLHIALQHSSDRMLEKMNRRNRFASDLELLNRLSDLGFALGTDYILGFPEESDEIFDEAYENLKKLPLTHIHLFTYSPKEGTPASLKKIDVTGDKVAERRVKINELIAQKHREFYSRLKKPLTVHIENNNSGFDEYFSRVEIDSQSDLKGFVTVDRWCYGEKISATV